MEIIIAIVIIAFGVAVWFNRKKPAAPGVEAETFSDNGIKFAAKEETTAPVVEVTPATVVEETPVKAPRKPRAPKAVKEKAPAKPKAPAKAKAPAVKKPRASRSKKV
jgi:FtsZ-interacting cell division protein ZipA